MRASFLFVFLLLFSLHSFSQGLELAVDRIDKRTKEHIRQTSMYLLKDGSGKSKLNFSARAVEDSYSILLNLPIAVNIKRGTELSITLENGKRIQLKSNTDIISLNETDISKKMMVFDLDAATEMQDLLKQPVKSFSIPTSNKGTVQVALLSADKGQIRAGLMLVQKK